MSNENYLQTAINRYKAGISAPLNHIGEVVASEQRRLSGRLDVDGFWFVDIPRTSSTSIQVNLGMRFGYPHGKSTVPGRAPVIGTESFLLPSHVPSFIARDVVGVDRWSGLKTFTVVREPTRWAVSLWRYTKRYGHLGFSDGDFETFLGELEGRIAEDVQSRPFFPSNYLQSDYILDPATNEELVKDILKFEDREGVERFLNERIGAPIEDGEILVGTDAETYDPSESETRLARRVLARDYDLLRY